MHIGEVPWSDRDAVRRLTAVTNAARSVDAPWLPALTERGCVGELRWGWDGEPAVGLLATVGGLDVGAARHQTSRYDNLHLAWIEVEIDPAHRRRGFGSQLLAHLLDRARAQGRTTVGVSAWDTAGPRAFAARHGFEQRSVEVHRRQHLAAVDRAALDALWTRARPAAAEYDLLRLPAQTPAAGLAEMAALTAAIHDAPTDELEIEDEVFTPERIAAYEGAWAARGHRLYRVLARHRLTGAPAGHSIVAVDGERPQLAEQHDTSVLRTHRGHRLGLLLKLEMLRWLAEVEPQVREVDTWNAESNDHMIAVNEALGYRALGRVLNFQRSV